MPKKLSIKLIQQFIQGKNPNQDLCEDAIFFSNDYVAVIDGATSKSDRLWEGKTSGKMASLILQKQLSLLPKNADAAQAFLSLNSALTAWYKQAGVLELMRSQPVERLTSSMVIFSNYYQQIWMLGDCQARIGNRVITNYKPIDKLLANLRSLSLELAIQKGASIEQLTQNDIGRKTITPFLKDQFCLQNSQLDSHFTYYVLDGFFTQIDKIKIVDIPPKTREVVLASDGYPQLESSLEASEKNIQTILQKDPLCFRLFKSTKGLKPNNLSFDDRAYIKFFI